MMASGERDVGRAAVAEESEEEFGLKRRRDYEYADSSGDEDAARSSADEGEDLGLTADSRGIVEERNLRALKSKKKLRTDDGDDSDQRREEDESESEDENDDVTRFDPEKVEKLLKAKMEERSRVQDKIRNLKDASMTGSAVGAALANLVDAVEPRVRQIAPKLKKMTPLVVCRFCKGEDCVPANPVVRKKGFQRPKQLPPDLQEILNQVGDYCRRLQLEGLVDVYEKTAAEVRAFCEAAEREASAAAGRNHSKALHLIRRNGGPETEGPYTMTDLQALQRSVAQIRDYEITCATCDPAGKLLGDNWRSLSEVLSGDSSIQ